VGPGLFFSHLLLNYFHQLNHQERKERIGVVGCGVGGTGMEVWHSPDGYLFRLLLTRISLSLASLQSNHSISSHHHYKIGGLIFYQGETDALKLETAQNYGKNLKSFIEDLRKEVYEIYEDVMPVIIVGITGSKERLPYLDVVRDEQKRICNLLENVYYVDAEGMELKEDGIHLTSGGQLHLASKLLDTYLLYSSP